MSYLHHLFLNPHQGYTIQCPLLAEMQLQYIMASIPPHIHHLALLAFVGKACLAQHELCSLQNSVMFGHHKPNDVHKVLPCCFAKMTVSTDHVPKQVRPFLLRSRIEDLLEPDGLRCLTSSTQSKNTGLAAPRLYSGGTQRGLVHPFPFLALPRHVREEPSQKKIRPAVAFGQAGTRTVW